MADYGGETHLEYSKDFDVDVQSFPKNSVPSSLTIRLGRTIFDISVFRNCIPECTVKCMKMSRFVYPPKRIVFEAVPGAGKTTLILKTCEEEDDIPSLIIAYNAELAKGVSRRVHNMGNVTCVTFHSLCSKCIAPSRDDAELLSAVERAEKGDILPKAVPQVKRVFIDEAQDVKDVYLRLLRVLKLTDGDIIILGDRNQLVYDFDPSFPASLATLDSPHILLGGTRDEWTREEMTVSHRMTHECAMLVNFLFGSKIRADRPGPPVEIRSPGRGFYTGLYACLSDVLLPEENDILLLVDRKSGNRPLKTLLNRLSRAGRKRIHVHGVYDQTLNGDGEEDEEGTSRLDCGTFWSAKGLEFDTVVVLLPGCAPRNPTYVALTRSSRRLIVVIDPKDPHPSMCRVVAEQQEEGLKGCVRVKDAFTWRVLQEGCERDEEQSFRSKGPPSKSRFRCMDSYRPPLTEDVRAEEVEVCMALSCAKPKEVSDSQSTTLNLLGDVFLVMGLLVAEGKRRDRVLRRVEDILHPTRAEYCQIRNLMQAGIASRIIPPFVPDDSLLAEDLRLKVVDAYARYKCSEDAPLSSCLADLFLLSLASLSWDSWDHTMRYFLSMGDEWLSFAVPHIHFMESVLQEAGEDLQMDVPLISPCGCSYVRVQATSPLKGCYHFVWEDKAQADVSNAAIWASCHPLKKCFLVIVKERKMLSVHSEGAILQSD